MNFSLAKKQDIYIYIYIIIIIELLVSCHYWAKIKIDNRINKKSNELNWLVVMVNFFKRRIG